MRIVSLIAVICLILLLPEKGGADTRRSIARANRFVTDLDSVQALKAEIANELNNLFGLTVPPNLQIKFVGREQFRELTPGIDFTAALYSSGAIHIPAQTSDRLILTESDLRKTLRHELFHAAVDNISSGRCPLWLEEGLAQIFEGSLHLAGEPSPPPTVLRGAEGFYTFDEKVMRQRYQSSRLLAQELIFIFGKETVISYLKELGARDDLLFTEYFGVEEDEFIARPIHYDRGGHLLMDSLQLVGALR